MSDDLLLMPVGPFVPEMTSGNDQNTEALHALRRELATTPRAAIAPNAAASFRVGVRSERAALLDVVEAHTPTDANSLLARQAAAIRGVIHDLADALVESGRRTHAELKYPNSAAGGANLLRDEVLATLGPRARSLGPRQA